MAGLLDLLAFHHRMLSIFGKPTHGEYDPNTSPIYTRCSSFPFPFHYPSIAPIKSTNILMFSLHTILAVLERARPPRKVAWWPVFGATSVVLWALGQYWGSFVTMQKKLETTIQGLGWVGPPPTNCDHKR